MELKPSLHIAYRSTNTRNLKRHKKCRMNCACGKRKTKHVPLTPTYVLSQKEPPRQQVVSVKTTVNSFGMEVLKFLLISPQISAGPKLCFKTITLSLLFISWFHCCKVTYKMLEGKTPLNWVWLRMECTYVLRSVGNVMQETCSYILPDCNTAFAETMWFTMTQIHSLQESIASWWRHL